MPRTTPSGRRRLLALGLAVGLLVSCSSSDPEPSTAELLAELEGRELSPAEVAEREQVAQVLCGLDDAVLVELWGRLSVPQLEFQDFVFGRQCPERNALYGQTTGRFVTNG